LLKLLAGEDVPFEGSLYLPPQLRVAYVPQDTSFLRGSLEDFALERGLDGNLLRAVLSRLGFERGQFDADLAGFSAGQKKKCLLAVGICREAHLYVWDEPLNHIDVISRMQIEELLLECKPSMVFVEHDQAFLRRVATRIVELAPGGAQELDIW
ncbi:Lsa family ABC-F type ribosomal protection protein, partial [Desulfovibrio sp. OttesenSCG-928-C06]|nr:Lsa family ABC-F type ribosomal protection protein [Desulfovibrio sp. OttesenSCG-928-C06]